MKREIQTQQTQSNTHLYVIAWGFGLLFYFLDYITRSAPAVMLPQLQQQFSIDTVGLVSMVGTYYYTYSVCSLIAGIALDKWGARYAIFSGTLILGIGCLLFLLSSQFAGNLGRLLQGAGCAFAFPGCIYLASKGFSPKSLATAIGFTQCLGMLGGSAGQFLVGPWMARGMDPSVFWWGSGVITIGVAIALFWVIPLDKEAKKQEKNTVKPGLLEPYKIVFSNPQSWLSGIISGLLFAPTTIFAMTWAVAFFQKDLSMDFNRAAITAAMVALGWVVGCPLLGFAADQIGRRKPVLVTGCFLMIAFMLQLIYLPNWMDPQLSLFLIGVASGAAMIPYSIIKEANPDPVKGSATGAMNFITFGITTLLAPVFSHFFGKTLENNTSGLLHFQQAMWFWIGGIVLAIVLARFLTETGTKKKVQIAEQ